MVTIDKMTKDGTYSILSKKERLMIQRERIKLESLYCYKNHLTELDLSKNINLIELYCHSNKLITLDLSNCINLERLYCDLNTKLLNYNNKTEINFL